MQSFRPARVAEVIREVAAETILFKLKDPRVSNVTVTRVEVSADLQTAKIYVSIRGDEHHNRNCLVGLSRSAGFIQHHLADRLKLRFTPHLRFLEDKGVKNSFEVTRILQAENPEQAEATLEETVDQVEGSPEEAGSKHA